MSVEKYISLAEITYKGGNPRLAIRHARTAIMQPDATPDKVTALRIFIARAHSKLGNINESNTIYRNLLRQNETYLPPIIMGLVYNNFASPTKLKSGLNLCKLYLPKTPQSLPPFSKGVALAPGVFPHD